VFFASQGTTPVEFLLGRHEPLPDDLSQWKDTGVVAQSGLLREERLLLAPGRRWGARLLRQVRYKDPSTGEIVRVEPDEPVRRRRVSTRVSR
jgi:hypothetical protein